MSEVFSKMLSDNMLYGFCDMGEPAIENKLDDIVDILKHKKEEREIQKIEDKLNELGL